MTSSHFSADSLFLVIIFDCNCSPEQFFIDTTVDSQHYLHCGRKWPNIYLTIWFTVHCRII